MSHPWIADRIQHFDSSGIRKVFDLAAAMTDPINLSIGQPDFDVPPEVQRAAIEAIEGRKNGYTPTQGIAPLREKLQERIAAEYGHTTRQVVITSGTSGGLVLALMALVNPGDEVIVFDPCFVMYRPLIGLAGGTCVAVDTYPDFRIHLDKLAAAISKRTKVILFNSPGNPTGAVASDEEIRGLARLASERNIALVSDEIYSTFCYDEPFVSPARYNPQTIVIDGFSKTHAMTGWRLGYAHGPAEVISQMIKMQQYTFVCAPQPAQWAGLTALDVDMSRHMADYRRKRDLICSALADDFELARPGGAFYVFPKCPWGTGDQFVHKAIENKLLIIPGHIFSQRDTHFRISYAASDATIERGVEVLNRLARERPRG
ncbi:MAG TPA: aminotransferase class I/II-fold pyridoxal phosphate-dependent enzyme [Pirellulales bacterium]|jgi:aspartate/methionine/tyrosine aminotransferase|nr:aminotransferase class I/II-fold pyridoxal phosphate-dependent enzyme [Pirellulales bacterium]